MRDRRIIFGVVAAAVVLMAARHPSANLRILTHERSDRAPQRIQAAVDVGVMAFSLLITWTAKPYS